MSLPGYSPNKNLGKEKFHKSQHFDFSNGVRLAVGEEKPGIGGEPLPGQKIRPKYSMFPQGEGSDTPSWVAFDKQVLCFEAHFKEPVHESRVEQLRIRKCKIYFFLEDGTIQVVEPEKQNSGIPQGTLIRRHRIPLPPPHDEFHYEVQHFNINQEVVFYSRTFRITDCDLFTKKFLTKLGIRLNLPAPTPEDPYNSLRRQMEESMSPLRPYERSDTLRQFLDHDRRVLRFFCHWDDSETMFGDSRELVLHYFLADDTIEIREVTYPNSGRDAVPKFLHRRKLPKRAPPPTRQPGEITDRTVLNVFGPMGHGGRYILDNLKTGAVHEEFYKDCDLTIGAVINVWGRKVVVCDCDGFTKEYYRTKYGVEDFTPVTYKASPAPKPQKEPPPYNGFGSEEDSLCSCAGLLPKPPQKDFKKLMEKDRQGLESNILRFVGRMVSDNPIDSERKFIISFYLSDDTISIFEPPQRNSGMIGGKFLERGRIKKPGQELFKSQCSEYFKAEDLYVGARVCFNNQEFQLVDADEYVFSYMEQHAEEFPKGNIGTIISKLRSITEPKMKEIKQSFMMIDPENTGEIAYEPFRNLLMDMAGGGMSEHEIMTIGRHYCIQEQTEIDLGFLKALAQELLRKKHFESFPDMTNAFMHADEKRTGLLPVWESRTICKAFKLPLPDDLLKAILEKFENGKEEVEYNGFLSAINWRDSPVPTALPETPIKLFSAVQVKPKPLSQLTVSYKALVEELCGHTEEK
ncbi:EF-hand domain-containing family member C2 isoform X1 [Lepisosteus oculatus]|uniref:EF-hand domain-containing family member C2 isoform X1 n=1 Tax=Lepisosteus oculatus TaxID=7918 RepID=UPI0007402C11|nr:PREDICTED: EF-hand domain-containing family member C2 isoform X1 [Lepisosteus oculatus]